MEHGPAPIKHYQIKQIAPMPRGDYWSLLLSKRRKEDKNENQRDR